MKKILIAIFVFAFIAGFICILPSMVGGIANYILADTRPDIKGLEPEPPSTAGWQSYSGDDVQAIGGRGEKLSCSLPKIVEFLIFGDEEQPIGLQMRQACITHDYCYRHGSATYGYGQEDCDFRLLRDVLRLCRFLKNSKRATQLACREQAKKVVLGVRTFGSKSFLNIGNEDSRQELPKFPDGKFSTYFEYEPFPINWDGHWAMRIADPIGGRQRHGDAALYVFRVKPAGLRMTIELKPNYQTGKMKSCNKYLLPTTAKWLTNSPMVVRRKIQNQNGDVDHEDWFVWFQRLSLDNSGSRFLALAPGRATQEDWQKVFPGFQPDCPNLRGRTHGEHIIAALEEAEPVSIAALQDAMPLIEDKAEDEGEEPENTLGPASAIFWTGNKKDNRYQNATSEFHPAPGFEPLDGTLKLMSLRTSSCIGGKTTLCFSDYFLDVTGKLLPGKSGGWNTRRAGITFNPQVPLRVRDRLNGMGKNNESMRYRNFSTPPFITVGTDRGPVISWMRRGTGKAGSDFDHRAEIRRMKIVINDPEDANQNTGGNVGNQFLENFTESNEPLAILGRQTLKPLFLSLALGKKTDEKGVFAWRLAAPSPPNIDSALPPVQISRNEHSCLRNLLDASWMYRPPLVLANEDNSSLLIFSRAETSIPGLSIRVVSVQLNGECALVKKATLTDLPARMGFDLVSNSTTNGFFKNLRKLPLLAWRSTTSDKLNLVLPVKNNPIWTVFDLT